MAVFRIEKTRDYTVMSNHHLKNKNLTLKAKGLMSLLLSLPDDWVHTLAGLAQISVEGVDAIRMAVHELEREGYVVRNRIRDEKGHLGEMEYVVYENPQMPEVAEAPASASPTLEEPMLENPTQGNPIQGNPTQGNPMLDHPTQGNPMQINTYRSNTHKEKKNESIPYRKAGYSKKFLAEHEGEIALHKAAKKAFDDLGLKKLPTIRTLRAEYAALLAEKKQTYAEFRQAREDMRQMLKAKANVELLLGIDDKTVHDREVPVEQR